MHYNEQEHTNKILQMWDKTDNKSHKNHLRDSYTVSYMVQIYH